MKTTQEPRATIRINGELYKELRAIAEARDITLQQAMDFWIDRQMEVRNANTKRTAGSSGSKHRKARSRAKKPKSIADEVNEFFRK